MRYETQAHARWITRPFDAESANCVCVRALEEGERAATMASSEGGQATTSSLYSTSTLESARKAKISMDTFYENLLIQDRDRSNR